MNYSKKLHPLGFYQVYPLPSQEELELYYKEQYFQKERGSYTHNYSDEEKSFFTNTAVIAEYIYRQFSNQLQGKLIDFGCGEGFFANYFLENLWEISCCDFSSFGIEQHNPSLLPHFIQGDLYKTLDSKIADGLVYDYINLANVLEHVRQPIELLEGIKKLMHPKTLLRIIVPNDFSLFQDLLVKKGLTQETWFVPPDHLNYFTFDSLTNLLNARGLQTFKVISDFPVEAFLFNEHSNYWSDRSRGKQAHLSRVTIENFLINQGIDNYINYREAAAKCNFGRSVIAFTYLAST